MIKLLQPPYGRENAIPLWWLAPPPCPVGSMSLDSRVAGLPYESSSFATPASGGTITRAYCRAAYEERPRGVLFCPRLRGKSGAAGKGEASAASQSAECLSYHMTLKVNPVTLTSYSSPAGRYHNPRPEGPSNLRTLRTLGAQPRQPSHRRCVQRACPKKYFKKTVDTKSHP